MDRLLSPNEAKFWLMDWGAPMNTVIVTRTAAPVDVDALRDSEFRLPITVLDRYRRPRWVASDTVGVVEEEAATDWLAAAERLLDRRVGSEGSPPWHALVLPDAAGAVVLLAVSHALADYRTGLWIADHFLAGTHPGPLAPACEEALPAALFGHPEAADLIEEWWLTRAAGRWEAIGLERLAGVLPSPAASRFDVVRLSEDETAAFQARCEEEGGSLNGAVATALRDVTGARSVAHAVDMSRFARPPLPNGPGLAVSHVFARNPDGPFWDAVRGVRTAVFDRIQAGEAGDSLLILPRALLREGDAFNAEPAEVTISGFPTYRRADAPGGAHPMQVVVSSARGGGDVVMLTYDGARLQLISCCPADGPGLDLGAIADRLRAATSAE